jgi:hypothetical protein
MNGVATGLLVFAFLAGVSLLVLWLHPRLPSAHRSKETTDIIRLGIGVVATVAALILALLISSVKNNFDQVNHDVQQFARGLVLTDRALRFYGPGAEPARALLVQYTERALRETWPDDKTKAIVQDPIAGALLDQTEAAIQALQSEGRKPIQAAAAADAIREVVRQRWELVEERGSAVSPTLVTALALWLGLIFASFGYNAPRNAAVLLLLLVCAASVAGAVFLVVDMDGPFTGLLTVPSDPVRRALAHMQQ